MKIFLVPVRGAAMLTVQPSLAQTYPGKPVRFVVPYAAGGPVDTVARLTAQKLTAYTRSEGAPFGKLIAAAGIPKE